MNIPQDWFIIELETLWETRIRGGGIIPINAAFVEARAKDDDWERNKHKRIYGTVVSAPLSYSDQKFNPIDVGTPSPKIFISGDLIQEKINEGYKDWNNKKYYPGLTDTYDFNTAQDIGDKIDVKVGERVYVNPMALEPDALIGYGEYPHFKVRCDDIIGAGTPIRSQGGWVWVAPEAETWEDITSKYGVIMKPTPGFKSLRGIVVAGPNQGKRVFFQTNSEWLFRVEGRELYCMEEENLLAEFE